MKIIIVFLSFIFIHSVANSQSSGGALAAKIATKMSDSLSLSDIQKSQVYDLNLKLHNQKMAMWQQYKGSDTLRIKLQAIENTRDSLYHTVLSDDQYQMYLSKKKNLVNNN